MARYKDASCKLCRREGEKLFLKGQRCYTAKCAIARRSFAPGQHGQGRKKLSEYGVQLREKQKTRRFYGVLESQFRKTYAKADKMKGKTGENLLQLIELRMDNVVYRMGFADSRAQARQLVNHGHFTVNGKRADIPSMYLGMGDVVAVKDKSKSSSKFADLSERVVPKWLSVNTENMTGRIEALPGREDVDLDVKEHLIVELYSK